MVSSRSWPARNPEVRTRSPISRSNTSMASSAATGFRALTGGVEPALPPSGDAVDTSFDVKTEQTASPGRESGPFGHTFGTAVCGISRPSDPMFLCTSSAQAPNSSDRPLREQNLKSTTTMMNLGAGCGTKLRSPRAPLRDGTAPWARVQSSASAAASAT
jgi:hypothetical protein